MTDLGLRKPDLLIWKDDKSALIDVTITGERFRIDGELVELKDQWNRKKNKYEEPSCLRLAEQLCGSKPVMLPLVMSVRGTLNQSTTLRHRYPARN